MENSQSDLCRICMYQHKTMYPPVNLISLHQIFFEDDHMTDITGVEIRRNDHLPQTICECCADQITRFHDFKNLCKATDELLKEMFTKGWKPLVKTEEELELLDLMDRKIVVSELDVVDYADPETTSIEKSFKSEAHSSDMEAETIDDTNEQTVENSSVKTSLVSCCCMCTQTFVTHDQLMAHIAANHSIIHQNAAKITEHANFSCPLCLRKFKTIYTLKGHQNKTKERAQKEHEFYYCQSCKEKFCVMKENWQAFLYKQKKVQVGYDCIKCIGEKEENTAEKKEQMKRHKSSRRRKYRCCMCLLVFTNIDDLVKHVEGVHSEEVKNRREQLNSTSQHVCQLCARPYKSEKLLRNHANVLQYSIRRRAELITPKIRISVNYKCCMCLEVFANNDDLVKHIEYVHSELMKTRREKFPPTSKHVCQFCNRSYSTSDALRFHADTRHYAMQKQALRTNANIKCCMCMLVFAKLEDLTKHIECVHSEVVKVRRLNLSPTAAHVCQLCARAYKSNRLLKFHADVIHYTRNRRALKKSKISKNCCMCPHSSFNNTDDLVKHVESAHSEAVNSNLAKLSPTTQHVCQLCNQRFNSVESLILHQNKQSQQRQNTSTTSGYSAYFYCCMCNDQQFNTPDEQKIHYAEVHPETWKKEATMNTSIAEHRCDLCCTSFDSKWAMSLHQRIKFYKNDLKARKGKSQCTVCGKVDFKTQVTVCERKHRHHQQHKIVQCDMCGMVLSYLSILAHLKKHLNKKEYKCEFCETACNTSSDLSEHRKIAHTGHELKCSVCHKTFARRYALKLHFLVHTGEQPYRCTFENCTVGFRRRSSLKNHIAWHSKIKRFVCDHCDKRFRSKYGLNKHLKQHQVQGRSV